MSDEKESVDRLFVFSIISRCVSCFFCFFLNNIFRESPVFQKHFFRRQVPIFEQSFLVHCIDRVLFLFAHLGVKRAPRDASVSFLWWNSVPSSRICVSSLSLESLDRHGRLFTCFSFGCARSCRIFVCIQKNTFKPTHTASIYLSLSLSLHSIAPSVFSSLSSFLFTLYTICIYM